MRMMLFAAIWVAIFSSIYASRAQNLGGSGRGIGETHSHPPEDAETHEKFYAGWLMPNGGKDRTQSCCNKQDCYPTTFKNVGGTWFARRREDGKWMPVPPSKIEHEQLDPRESPDGRGHVCAAPPHPNGDSSSVYCAVLGAGI